MDNFTVSLGVVALNEEKFLQGVLKDFKNQTYPHKLIEILLIDGGSLDETKEIMERFAKDNAEEFLSIKVLDNPNKIQAAGWNVAIKNMSGDVLIRIDAHAHIPEDFTKLNIENIANGEFVTGGQRPCLTEKKSLWSKLLLMTENSIFGSSFGRKKNKNEKQYVDTLFHLAYRKEVFDKVGLFNEKLLRTEDNEMHYRIRSKGYKILFDPRIISYQYSRNTLRKMIKQKYGNGFWVGATMHECPGCISKFHFAPMLFVIALLVCGILSAFCVCAPIMLLLAVYLLFGIVSAIVATINEGFTPFIILMPFIFFLLHVSYGVGTIIGLIKGC